VVSGAEEVQQAWAVGGLRDRLGDHGADSRLDPGDLLADRQVACVHCRTQVARVRVAGDHRERHGGLLEWIGRNASRGPASGIRPGPEGLA